ncbi:NAD(P)H-binding protein [Klebsiella variicola subsp. variicola]|uniref:NAD(P)H-binding protein n=1 Tax=Klebsiella variicola TaxID=244366 RepID=UPI00292BA418|nr:NAD(P)H-binding protein [Klebsiella variicola]MDV1441218.1 NAD(P)H-binding protein [Klebsiella variicola subsp. variicola]
MPAQGRILRSIIATWRQSAKIIENAGLDHTIIRPAWFTNGHEVEYGLTHRNQPFRGSSVSRLSIADLINRMVIEPSLYLHDSLGIARV